MMRSTTSQASRRPGGPSGAQSYISLQQNIWHPSRGIVFNHSSLQEHPGPASLRDHPPSPNREATSSNLSSKSIILKPQSSIGTAIPTAIEVDVSEGVVMNPAYDELPDSQATFKMTEELFRAAKNADPGTAKSFWSHQLYRGPSGSEQDRKPTIHYCKSKHTTERVLEAYFMDQKLVGFDIEWNPSALKQSGSVRDNISLVQIATEGRILLCHLALYPKSNAADFASPLLIKLMEDPNITKVGVAIKADCTRLRKYLGINSQGLFELSHLYKLIKYSVSKDYKLINKSLVSLAAQVQEHLHLPLFKGGDVRSSNWSQKLALQQILYAAADSYAAVMLYHTMEFKRKLLDPTPPRPFHAELNLPIRIAEGVDLDLDVEDDTADIHDVEAKLPTTKPTRTRSMMEQCLNLEADVVQAVTSPNPSVPLLNLPSVISTSKLSATELETKVH